MAFFKFGNFDALVFQSGGISESKVNELIEKNNEQILSQVEQKIGTSFAEAQSSGLFDDTKVYNTYADMVTSEPMGRKDVLYILITDEEYFENDIVGMFCDWLKKVYGEDTLEEKSSTDSTSARHE